jgi:hypothetical protein
VPELALSVDGAVAGHSLVPERRGARGQPGPRVESMWQVMLPRFATDAWLRQHRR